MAASIAGAESLWWLPTGAVAALAVLAVIAIAAQPRRPARHYWLALVLLGGALAVGATAWQQAKSRAAVDNEAARLRQLATQLDEVSRLLPPAPGGTAATTFGTVAAGILSLQAKIKDLEDQVRVLQAKSRGRQIEPEIQTNLADYLKPLGPHRVVISCIPDDVEAYAYANQLANLLRLAGWDALGPQNTTIFGEGPAMGVKLVVRNTAGPPDTAKILIDAFTRFNIPFQSGLSPSEAIPDPATVELFVGKKP